MHTRIVSLFAIMVYILVAAVTGYCDAPKNKPSPKQASPREQTRQAIERGLVFLEKDAAKWRKERNCATCHHGAMTVWTYSEAALQGYAIRPELLAETVAWDRAQFLRRFDPAKDLAGGFKVMPIAMVKLVFAANAKLPGLTPQELSEIETHITRRQETDGSWPPPPPKNGPLPFFESREVMTLWAYLALERFVPADPKQPSAARTSREKAADWLSKTIPSDTTQATALRLLFELQARRAPPSLKPGIERLLSRQNPDGGWSQIKSLPSDAFATGQALYALNLAGVPDDRPEIKRAVAFLVAQQRPDGSWPMTPRETPERKASTNTMPIIYFGSAWATLGLVRYSPG